MKSLSDRIRGIVRRMKYRRGSFYPSSFQRILSPDIRRDPLTGDYLVSPRNRFIARRTKTTVFSRGSSTASEKFARLFCHSYFHREIFFSLFHAIKFLFVVFLSKCGTPSIRRQINIRCNTSLNPRVNTQNAKMPKRLSNNSVTKFEDLTLQTLA